MDTLWTCGLPVAIGSPSPPYLTPKDFYDDVTQQYEVRTTRRKETGPPPPQLKEGNVVSSDYYVHRRLDLELSS